MYRLLIVSADRQIRDVFMHMQPRDLAEFKPPHFRDDMQGALDCIQKHAIDAVAVEERPEYSDFRLYLDQELPCMPIFTLASTVEEQKNTLNELSRVLRRLSIDDSNLAYDVASRMEQLRENWLKRALCGMIPTEKALKRLSLLYRYGAGIATPSVLARFSIPENDDFLSDRWHYGSERLETALRNFFGVAYNGMNMHVAVVSPEEVRVLCVPSDAACTLKEETVYDYITETAEQIDHYLGLRLKLIELKPLNGLKQLVHSEQ